MRPAIEGVVRRTHVSSSRQKCCRLKEGGTTWCRTPPRSVLRASNMCRHSVQAPHASTLLYSILFLTAILPVSNWSSSWSTTRPVQDGGRKLLENRLVLVMRGGIDGKLSDGVAEGAQDGSEKDGASQDATRDAGAEESEFTASGAEHSSAILERSGAGGSRSRPLRSRRTGSARRRRSASSTSPGRLALWPSALPRPSLPGRFHMAAPDGDGWVPCG